MLPVEEALIEKSPVHPPLLDLLLNEETQLRPPCFVSVHLLRFAHCTSKILLCII